MSKFIPDKNDLWMLPLGGCGAFGANATLYGHDGWWILVDCGTAFIEDRHLGIDMMLPDLRFIEERKDRLAAIIITHAHEDHIGGLPYIWPQLRAPVFATPFAAEVIKRKCSEFEEARPMVIKPLPLGSALKFHGFEVVSLPLCHSIVEPRALHIKTPAGNILHTGDWNDDQTPVIGHKTEEKTFANLGPLSAVVGDSTNAMVAGRSGTESAMQPAFEEIFTGAKGAVAVTMFSSNIGRIISIAHAAKACKRHVAVVGRSLRAMIDAAKKCGYLDNCPAILSDKEAGDMPASRLVYLIAGSQGENRSALARVSRDEHPFISLGQDDVVCFSARAIPGNEKRINEVINNLIMRRVKVITANDAPIHVSGHAYGNDIKRMLGWTKPQTVIAVHGEMMQQDAHVQIALQCDVPHAIAPQNGEIWSLAAEDKAPRKVTQVHHGYHYIENNRILDPDHGAIAQRRKMGFNGAVFVSVIKREILISPLGLIDDKDADDQELLEDLQGRLTDIIAGHSGSSAQLSDTIRNAVRRFFDTELGYKPVVIVHVAG